ncbi:MAG: FHA domain-containing protein [Spirochaetales bacterium]|nr:FHA domain-containing protein [Spirochaetales bacterium]
MMDETLHAESNIGKRLNKLRKLEKRCLLFKGNVIPIVTEITIGRDRSNCIVVEDNMVSRFHAVIQKIKNAYFIKDLKSTNGTKVNGVDVPKDKYIKLKKCDVIQIGRTDFTFE